MPSRQLISISILGKLSFGNIIIVFHLYVLRVNLLAINQLVTLVNSMARRSFNSFGELVLTSTHVSSANKRGLLLTQLKMLLIYKKNNSGPIAEPYGTPIVMLPNDDW